MCNLKSDIEFKSVLSVDVLRCPILKTVKENGFPGHQIRRAISPTPMARGPSACRAPITGLSGWGTPNNHSRPNQLSRAVADLAMACLFVRLESCRTANPFFLFFLRWRIPFNLWMTHWTKSVTPPSRFERTLVGYIQRVFWVLIITATLLG